MLNDYSFSQFEPKKTIGARNLKEILRKAIAESNGKQSLEVGLMVSFRLFFHSFKRESNIQFSPTLRKVGAGLHYPTCCVFWNLWGYQLRSTPTPTGAPYWWTLTSLKHPWLPLPRFNVSVHTLMATLMDLVFACANHLLLDIKFTQWRSS